MPLKNMSIRPSDPAPEGVKLFGKDGRKKCDKLREFKMRWNAQNEGWNHSPRWKQYSSTTTTVIPSPAGHTAPHQSWQQQGWQWSKKHMSCCYRKALTLQSAVPGLSGPPCSTKSSTHEHCPSEEAMTCWPRLTLQTLVQPSQLATHGWRCPAVVSCFTPCAAGPCHALGWALLSCQGEAQALSRQLQEAGSICAVCISSTNRYVLALLPMVSMMKVPRGSVYIHIWGQAWGLAPLSFGLPQSLHQSHPLCPSWPSRWALQGIRLVSPSGLVSTCRCQWQEAGPTAALSQDRAVEDLVLANCSSLYLAGEWFDSSVKA